MSMQDDHSKGRKRVRLSQEPMVHFLTSYGMTESEREKLWWRQEDFDAARASIKRMCRTLRKTRRFSGCLTDAYERACSMTSPGSDDLESLPDDLLDILRSTQVSNFFVSQ